MLQNAYFLAKIGADTAENEQHFAEILPKTALMVLRAAEAPGHHARSATYVGADSNFSTEDASKKGRKREKTRDF